MATKTTTKAVLIRAEVREEAERPGARHSSRKWSGSDNVQMDLQIKAKGL